MNMNSNVLKYWRLVGSEPFLFRYLSTSAKTPQQKTPQPKGAGIDVFDRQAKRMHRNWAAGQPDHKIYEYIREEVGYRVADRIYDCKRFFENAVDLGCGRGLCAPHIFKENVGCLLQVDIGENMLAIAERSPEVCTERLHADEEKVPLKPQSTDLIISSLSMHWINDLPGFFRRCFEALREDGAFIAAMFGGETLYELRVM